MSRTNTTTAHAVPFASHKFGARELENWGPEGGNRCESSTISKKSLVVSNPFWSAVDPCWVGRPSTGPPTKNQSGEKCMRLESQCCPFAIPDGRLREPILHQDRIEKIQEFCRHARSGPSDFVIKPKLLNGRQNRVPLRLVWGWFGLI